VFLQKSAQAIENKGTRVQKERPRAKKSLQVAENTGRRMREAQHTE
jgi:hypothetical protein